MENINTAIFIDGITLFHGLNGKRFHFNKFKSWLLQSSNNINVNNIDVYSAYFNIVSNLLSKQTFFSHVTKSGFITFIRKPLKNPLNGIYNLNHLNIELTVQAMSIHNKFDKFILVSGKYDYLPLCEKLKMYGKDIEIIGFKNSINKSFNKYSIRYIDDFLHSQNIKLN